MNDDTHEATARHPGFSRRNFIIGAGLAVSSGVAFARQPAVANPVIDQELFEGWVPGEFGQWSTAATSGVLLPPPDALRDRLYDNLVTRVYTASGLPTIMLLLAYNNAQDGVVQVHRPEVCYPVGGFLLSETRDVSWPIGGTEIPANIFTAKGPSRTEQVAYFTRMGDAFPRNWIDQRLAVMKANLAGIIPDGMMMRASALGLDQQQAQPLLADFAAQFIENSDPKLKQLLVGSIV